MDIYRDLKFGSAVTTEIISGVCPPHPSVLFRASLCYGCLKNGGHHGGDFSESLVAGLADWGASVKPVFICG